MLFRKKRPNFVEHLNTDTNGIKWIDTEFFGFGDFSPAKDNTGLHFPTAEEYLRQYGNKYPWKEFWLEHGETLTAPSKKSCLEISRAGGHIPGNCYNNALRLALQMHGRIILPHTPREVLYGEGLAIHPTGAYPHAWLVIDGNIYDPTWPDAYRASYYGITLDPHWMLNFAESVGKVSLIQNWHSSEPLLSTLFKQSAA